MNANWKYTIYGNGKEVFRMVDGEIETLIVDDKFVKSNAIEPADVDIEPTQKTFQIPVVAPDFRVQSPEIPTDRKKAMQDAVKESKKISKSVPFIAMANTHVLEGLLARVEDLEKQLKKMSI